MSIIAIKARCRTEYLVDATGTIREEREAPETARVGASLAIAVEEPRDDRETLWLVDEADASRDAVRARPADVPERTDLPRDHPLYGQRVLRVVPAGMSDCTLDDEGRLVALDPPKPDPVLEPVLEPVRG
jgi:hypothetical protein